MPPKSETRAGQPRASRNSCGGWFRALLYRSKAQTQFLVAAHDVRMDLSAVIAPIAFGERGNA
jgi:hypothetical protein